MSPTFDRRMLAILLVLAVAATQVAVTQQTRYGPDNRTQVDSTALPSAPSAAVAAGPGPEKSAPSSPEQTAPTKEPDPTSLRGRVRFKAVAVPEMVLEDGSTVELRTTVPISLTASSAPESYQVEVTGALSGEGDDRTLEVQDHRILGPAHHFLPETPRSSLEGTVRVMPGGLLLLETAGSEPMLLEGPLVSHLAATPGVDGQTVRVVGPVAVNVQDYISIHDASRKAETGAEPKRYEGVIRRDAGDRVYLMTEDGARYGLAEDLLLYDSLAAMRSYGVEVYGYPYGPAADPFLQVLGYRALPYTLDSFGYAPVPAIPLYPGQPVVLEGMVFVDPLGRQLFRTPDGRVLPFTGGPLDALYGVPSVAGLPVRILADPVRSGGDLGLELLSYALLAEAIGDTAALPLAGPTYLTGRVIDPYWGPPYLQTLQGGIVPLTGDPVQRMLSSAALADRPVRVLGVLDSDGDARVLDVVDFDPLDDDDLRVSPLTAATMQREALRQDAKLAREAGKAQAEALREAAKLQREDAKADRKLAREAMKADRELTRDLEKAQSESLKRDRKLTREAEKAQRERGRDLEKAQRESVKRDRELAREATKVDRERARDLQKAQRESLKRDREISRQSEKAQRKAMQADRERARDLEKAQRKSARDAFRGRGGGRDRERAIPALGAPPSDAGFERGGRGLERGPGAGKREHRGDGPGKGGGGGKGKKK